MKPDAPRPSPPGGSDRLTPGTSISRKVRIDALIGQGGMAQVYKGYHLLLDEPVAVKVMRRELMGMKDVVARFLREARAAAKVRSEHAVTVYDVDELEGGQPYMLMELLAGEDLAARTDRLGRFAVPDAVSIILEACVAVRVAHDAGIVHRDIKPANLFMARGRSGAETVKVLDFGISKVMTPVRSGDGPSSSITSVGALLGSPRYMAPEQMIDARNVDGRADIWSLACTLYTLLAGRPAFDGDSIPIICTNVLTSAPQPVHHVTGDVPEALGAVIDKALSKAREDRHADIAELVAALTPFAGPSRFRPQAVTAPVVVAPEPPSAGADERSTKRIPQAPQPTAAPTVAKAVDEEPKTRVVSHVPASTMVSSSTPLPSAGQAPPSTFDGMRAPDASNVPAASSRKWPLVALAVGVTLLLAAAGVWRVRGAATIASAPGEVSGTSANGAAAPPVAPTPSAASPAGGAPSVVPVASVDATADAGAAPSAASASGAPSSSGAPPSSGARRPADGSRPPRGRDVPTSPQNLPDPFGGEQK